MKLGGLKPPIVLKLGGSVVTFKDRLEAVNLEVLRRLSREIAESRLGSLLVVHGGGSFGHPYAKAYGLAEGRRGGGIGDIQGVSKTREAMVRLNSLVVEALSEAGIPAAGFQTSALASTRKGGISTLNLRPLITFLRLGGVPVLYGDVVFDSILGFTILSGDKLSAALALKLKSPRLIMGVDVDGVYTSDPKVDPEAKLVRRIRIGRGGFKAVLAGLKGSRSVDVTGGMRQKILEVKGYASKGGRVLIVNALKPGLIAEALRGRRVRGTLITA